MSDALSAAGHAGEERPDAPVRLLQSQWLWAWVLVAGAAIWLVTAVATGLTDLDHLIPNVVLVGSFLVPVSLVLFALARTGDGYLTVEHVIVGFLGGGLLGTVFAGVTETYFLPNAAGTFVAVGLFEETAKAAVLVLIATRVPVKRGRDGMILGATVGAGFAAFESAGYALSTFLDHRADHPVLNIVSTEAQRAVVSPFGHLTWTSLAGGAIFAAWRGGGFGPISPVVWTFAGVVALHAAWDSTYGWAIMIARGLAGDGWDSGWPATDEWIGRPTGAELTTFNVAYGLLIGANALAGTVWVIRRWRHYRAQGAQAPSLSLD